MIVNDNLQDVCAQLSAVERVQKESLWRPEIWISSDDVLVRHPA